MLHRQFQLCMDMQSKLTVKNRLLSKFRRSNIHPHAVEAIVNAPTAYQNARNARPRAQKGSWLILGCQPVYDRLGLGRALRQISKDPHSKMLWSLISCDPLCIGFRSTLPSFEQRVKALLRESAGVDG